MSRAVLEDGRWFNPACSTKWDEGTCWNGNNHISLATGSQWDHQRLYRTKGGLWILYTWSQWQGSGESYEEISAEAAAQWLVRNEHDVDDAAIPDDVADAYAALEVQ